MPCTQSCSGEGAEELGPTPYIFTLPAACDCVHGMNWRWRPAAALGAPASLRVAARNGKGVGHAEQRQEAGAERQRVVHGLGGPPWGGGPLRRVCEQNEMRAKRRLGVGGQLGTLVFVLAPRQNGAQNVV